MKKFKHVDLHNLLEERQFVPQAIISGDVEDISNRFHLKVEKNTDDFDAYVGTAFDFNGTPVAVMRYAGHPNDEFTVYLPFEIKDEDRVTHMIHEIVAALKISDGDILWERKDDPDL